MKIFDGLIAEHSGMSVLSTGNGASAVPSAPSNPNTRYNCSLSHAELVLLVEKSKEAQFEIRLLNLYRNVYVCERGDQTK